MDHDVACDCPFRDACATYTDPMIDGSRAQRKNRGCLDQSDVYRNTHCGTFRCMYLTQVVSQVLGHKAAAGR